VATILGEVVYLFVSPGHNFFGHHGSPPDRHPVHSPAGIECVAKRGIVGDRFFGYKSDYKGQITLFEAEVFEDLCNSLGVHDRGPGVLRRNVVTRGVRLNDLIGREFWLDGVRVLGREECRPCYWMDQAFAPGAEAFLKGRGGLRAALVSTGQIRVGGQIRMPQIGMPQMPRAEECHNS
jgi:MOSC domain-containing protein YiiM